MKQAIYVPMHAGQPYSFDPLDADRHENLPAARMLYATPIEIAQDNTLVSQVLESFTYAQEQRVMTWKIRSGITYSDGSAIQPRDVALAVVRMLRERPDFPVISEIAGLKEWLSSKVGLRTLPSGISVTGPQIDIRFQSAVTSPFFRFTLELFSIIPERCIDLNSGKLLCKQIPSSGNYVIQSRSPQEIVFQQRRKPDGGHHVNAPEVLVFRYLPSRDLTAAGDGALLNLSEFAIKSRKTDLNQLGYHVKSGPSADFIAMLISPLVKPFDRPECRQVFAAALREVLARDLGDHENTQATLFTKIIPGYLSPDQLIAASADSCLEYLRAHPVPWARFPKENNYYLDGAIERTAERLGVKFGEVITLTGNSSTEWPELFRAGKTAFLPFQTGFWAMDPVGDVRMLFTPNLHKDLGLVANDRKLQALLQELKSTPAGTDTRLKMEEINRYIFAQSIFNPIFQFKKLYASKDASALIEFPLAVQQPYPWQIFSR